MKDFEKGLFYLEGIESVVEGYTKGDHWNGWECACFSKEVSEDILTKVANLMERSKFFYDKKNDRFILFEDGLGSDDFDLDDIDELSKLFDMSTKDLVSSYNAEVYEKHTIFYNNENKEVYWIGAYSWIWRRE